MDARDDLVVVFRHLTDSFAIVFGGADAGGVLTPMVRSDLLTRVGGFDESLASAEDCDLWMRLSLETVLTAVMESGVYAQP